MGRNEILIKRCCLQKEGPRWSKDPSVHITCRDDIYSF